ncbi:hypothetical protein JCM24511_05910 [Saitozyma sp. JCM 24511]|nr:hypothetical protein JCM24511_05910 [Saitozyma sp. JCM 24511]
MSATIPMPTPLPTPAPRPPSAHPLPQPHPSPPIDIVHESTLAALRLTDFSTPASPAQTSSDLPPPDYSSIVNRSAPAAANGIGARPELSAQEISNREKQAIRDARRREDEARERGQAMVLGEPLSPPPDSVEPSLWDKSHSDSTTVSSPRPAGASPRASTFDQPNGNGTTNGNGTDTGVMERGARRSRGNSGATVHTAHTRKILPEGLQVKDALGRCEDPTLGWSLQFWITIADPVTQHVFFACPATGQTSWSPPEGVFIVPRQAAGEWWELADTSRGNRSYFYNTLTKKTQWTRPGGDAFVIPLGLIQGSVTRLGRLGRLDTPPVSWSLALTVS